MLTQLIARYAIYTIIVFSSYWICRIISFKFTFYGDEWIYPFLHWLNLSSLPLILLILIIGYTRIAIRLWKKTIGYIEEIVYSVENIYNPNQTLIELSDDLKEIEFILNNFKCNIELSQRIAKEAEKRKNDLIVYVAHDLKTPLTSVLGYLTLLKNEKNISRELQEKYLNITFEKAERLEDLINEFFEITRFNTSNIKLERQKINLSRLLEQMVFELKPLLLEKSLDYQLLLEKNIIVMCDANKIERSFDNILRNAINYSYSNTIIDISLLKRDEFVEVIFGNKGDTITRHQLSQLFEQFYRVDSARNSLSGGSGLGLAIAKEIIEAHEGLISAESKENEVKIKVILPIA